MPAPFGNRHNSKWTHALDAALRSHVETNSLSYAAITCRLNAQFGTNFSRNATIGRAGRIGLINPFKVKKPKQAKAKNRPRPRIIANNGNSNSMRVVMSVESTADMKLRCVEIVPRNLSLMELEPGDCRYPYGDGPFTFCGHTKTEDSSYCGPHHDLTLGTTRGFSDEHRQHLSGRARKILGTGLRSLAGIEESA